MFEINGKYGVAKIFTDLVDQASISQVYSLLNQSFADNAHIRMMPDIHAGSGCTVGTTMKVTDKICPNLVGVDGSCGMEVVQIKEKRVEFQKLDRVIRENVPSGGDHRSVAHRYNSSVDYNSVRCPFKLEVAKLSLSTLGGGNHFIELDKDDEDNLYLVIHSGSRHFGLEVANYYQKVAYEQLCNKDKYYIDIKSKELIESLKNSGQRSEIDKKLKELKKGVSTSVPYELAYCSGYLFDDYLNDMSIINTYARLNRKAMVDEIVKGMGWHIVDQFTTVHNYIDTDNMILRKGSVSAQRGERIIIPMNMRDGSLICVGKGNEDWNYSAPHGAGRIMSRSEAKSTLEMGKFRKEMEGIYSTSICKATIDESPMAYKPMQSILDNIVDTVDVINVIKPVYNFKAGDMVK